jgi:hypothetical protein
MILDCDSGRRPARNRIARAIPAHDDDTLLTLIGEIQGLLDLDELVDGLLRVLPEAVPSDYISLNDVGPDPEGVVAVILPEQPLHLHQAFARHAYENPIAAHYAATHEGRPFRLSDLTTTEELHATSLYREVYAPLRVEYQIAFTLPASPGRILAIAMSRGDRDFSDEERDLLTRARPFLIQAWRNAIQHTALRDDLRRRPFEDGGTDGAMSAALRERGLTARQAEVLWLVERRRRGGPRPQRTDRPEAPRALLPHARRQLPLGGRDTRLDAGGLDAARRDAAPGPARRADLALPRETRPRPGEGRGRTRGQT